MSKDNWTYQGYAVDYWIDPITEGTYPSAGGHHSDQAKCLLTLTVVFDLEDSGAPECRLQLPVRTTHGGLSDSGPSEYLGDNPEEAHLAIMRKFRRDGVRIRDLTACMGVSCPKRHYPRSVSEGLGCLRRKWEDD